MIPKIIHYCWFGGKEKPKEVNDYILTWKRVLPDYQIIEWNESNFDLNFNQYVKEAYDKKKYAFVSDVCRLYALKEMGGVYLDTDVEVLKSFDSFLNKESSFLGEEQKGKLLGTAVIGAEPCCPWICRFIELYDTLFFVKKNGTLDITPNTERLTQFLKKSEILGPKIYPIDFFCAKDYKSGRVTITDNTVCVHHYAESWVEPLKCEKYEALFWKFFGMKNLNILGKIYGRVLLPIKRFLNYMSMPKL